jgi:hypothetical protein
MHLTPKGFVVPRKRDYTTIFIKIKECIRNRNGTIGGFMAGGQSSGGCGGVGDQVVFSVGGSPIR